MNTNQTTPSEALAASVHAMLAGTSVRRGRTVLSLYKQPQLQLYRILG